MLSIHLGSRAQHGRQGSASQAKAYNNRVDAPFEIREGSLSFDARANLAGVVFFAGDRRGNKARSKVF
jgi:hypothetical protein